MPIKVVILRTQLSVPFIYSRIDHYYEATGFRNQLASRYVQVTPGGPDRDKETDSTLLVFDSRILESISAEFLFIDPVVQNLTQRPNFLQLAIPSVLRLGLVQAQIIALIDAIKLWYSLAADQITVTYPNCCLLYTSDAAD